MSPDSDSKITFLVLVASPGAPQGDDMVYHLSASIRGWLGTGRFALLNDLLNGHWGLAVWLEGSSWVWALALFSAIGVAKQSDRNLPPPSARR